ncbi:MAG TPA: hypothetical protein VIZ43_08465 [Trebonia sp.]
MADMTDLAAEVKRLQQLPAAIGADLAVLGGILRCGKCGTGQPLGDVADHLSNGWPSCCGQTMTWVTAKMLAAERREVPAGYHLEAVPEASLSSGGRWRVATGKRCRGCCGGGRKACGQPSAAELDRSHIAGRQRWYAYCANHAYGRFVESGQVMCWILKADEDG